MIRFALLTAVIFSVALPATAADYADLRTEYDQLSSYLGSKRRIDTRDRAAITALRTDVSTFAAEHADDPRPIILRIQLSTWLGDAETVDGDFAKLAAIADNDQVWLAWAQARIAENRYDDAFVLLADREASPENAPEFALAKAQCLVAHNRFDEAVEVLDAVPAEMLDAEPRLKGQVSAAKSAASRWQPLWEDELALREQEDAEGTLPIMQIQTSRGPLTVVLLENQAPNTVANFVNLAEKGFFNNQRFHRVLPNFVAQAGDPNSTVGSEEEPGSGGPGYTIPDEVSNLGKRKHFGGVLAMAKPGDPAQRGRTQPNSAGSQWYITLEPQQSLDQEYTVFGRVIDGQAIAEMIREDDDVIAITTVSRREKDYIPTTIPLLDETP
jgi:peptidyl-prolyl cis-trans isomerase B (cyclophilin B)